MSIGPTFILHGSLVDHIGLNVGLGRWRRGPGATSNPFRTQVIETDACPTLIPSSGGHRQIILNFFWDFGATYPQNDTCRQIPSTYDTVTPPQTRALKSHANCVAPVLPLRLTATQDKCDLNVRGPPSKTALPSHSLDKMGSRG